MSHEPDEVAAEVERLLTHAGQALSHRARQRALARTRALESSAAQSRQRSAAALQRLEAERQLAHAQFALTHAEAWWEQASPGEIVETWQSARAWQDHDPVAAATLTHLRGELSRRFGIDPTAPARISSDPGRAGELAVALADLADSTGLCDRAGQASVADLVRGGGPRLRPRARHGRGRGGAGQEREQGR